ncbi:unnamed protein product [Cuscuta campestris]|uniref:RRM domain-containing protein n=1 Tax=Cuscuta campestris TaxID=132261 RepID=A0A484N1M0_9ASTE|nr:unnamed protein product [Cuscuta campestris]
MEIQIPEEDPKARGKEYLDLIRLQKVTIQNNVCITPLAPPYYPFVKLVGLDSSMDKKYLLQIFDPEPPGKVIALQVVREDGEPYAFIQFRNLEIAEHAMKNYRNWMPTNVEMCWFRDLDEEGHRDKHPKLNHPNLLLPDIPRKQVIYLHRLCFIPSIERITVKDIKNGGAGAKIYGKVIVFDEICMQVLYCCGASESEEKRRGDDLKLKGPHCSTLEISYGITIGINLFEDRGDGQERVFARGVFSNVGDGVGFYEGEVGGDGGVVSVVFATLSDAVWGLVCISGLHQNMRVYGCIKASREIVRKQSDFVMFARSSSDDCVRVGPDGFLPLDRSMVIASKRAGLTLSFSLNLCGDDGEWRVLQKDLVFEAVFKNEAQTIDIDSEDGEVITVSITYDDNPKIDSESEDEHVAGGPDYDEVMELAKSQSALNLPLIL